MTDAEKVEHLELDTLADAIAKLKRELDLKAERFWIGIRLNHDLDDYEALSINTDTGYIVSPHKTIKDFVGEIAEEVSQSPEAFLKFVISPDEEDK